MEAIIQGAFIIGAALLGYFVKYISGQNKADLRTADSGAAKNYGDALNEAIETIRGLQKDMRELQLRVDGLEKEKDQQAEKIQHQEKEIIQLRKENAELTKKLEEYQKKTPSD